MVEQELVVELWLAVVTDGGCHHTGLGCCMLLAGEMGNGADVTGFSCRWRHLQTRDRSCVAVFSQLLLASIGHLCRCALLLSL